MVNENSSSHAIPTIEASGRENTNAGESPHVSYSNEAPEDVHLNMKPSNEAHGSNTNVTFIETSQSNNFRETNSNLQPIEIGYRKNPRSNKSIKMETERSKRMSNGETAQQKKSSGNNDSSGAAHKPGRKMIPMLLEADNFAGDGCPSGNGGDGMKCVRYDTSEVN